MQASAPGTWPTRKRILFVDDDPVLGRVYASVLQSESHRWEVRSAASGLEALDMIARTPFDVVVTDLRMPQMTGIELMAKIRELYPRTSRIILSGIRDQGEIARSLGDTHQFIPKPVKLETLRESLARICGLDSLLMDEKLRALVGRFGALPSFPALYLEVMNELEDPEPSIERVAEIVAQDPAMTAKMLHIVNSAAFGLARKISSPLDAVQYLGTGTVRSLVLSVHVFSSFDRKVEGFSIDQFEGHALRCARLARALLESQGPEAGQAEDAYIAGMLHDVGKLMLATSVPDRYREAAAYAVAQQIPLHAAEAEVFGATHAGVGAYLLGLWGLPAPIVEAVAFHHHPNLSDMRTFGPLASVHVANVLDGEQSKAPQPRPSSELNDDYLTALKVQDQLANWRGLAQKINSVPER
jgi:HD-like signal output (HDOD) protein/ActR/RegA family two-component response regulator